MVDIIIKNGTIVTDSEMYKADIGITGEKIELIGKNIEDADAEVIDAAGMYIMPGAIDGHVHLQLPFCGTVSMDTFDTGTRAAAAGGVTTLIDFAIQQKGQRITEAVEARRKEADGVVNVDYALHGGLTDWNETTRQDIKTAVEAGITSFKMFLIYKSEGWIANDPMLVGGLTETAKHGAMIQVHAESNDMLDELIAKHHNEEEMKKHGAYLHVITRPNYIEEEAIQRAIKWAEISGGQLFIVHMSTGGGADLVKAAREKGIKIIAETCPQYLLLTDERFKEKDGHLYGTCPQLKKPEDTARLWDGLAKGEVSVVGTDTCTFDTKQKAMWGGDFTKIPFGMPGIETLVPLMYNDGVLENRIDIHRFVQLISTNPAKVFGLYPNKGSLQIGTDADILIFDPEREFTIRPEALETNCDWSPFDGKKVKGYPYITIVRGKIVGKQGKFVGEPGYGRFVPCGPCKMV